MLGHILSVFDLKSVAVSTGSPFPVGWGGRMNTGKMVFSQLMDFLPAHEFHRCVGRYGGHYKMQSFTCWKQFLAMAFAQLTYRESLRDIEACLQAMPQRLYHMGIRGRVARSTLADANESRDWRIFEDFGQVLIGQARDSTPERVSAWSWTTRRTRWMPRLSISASPCSRGPASARHKGAVKLHTLLDLRGSIPCFVHITDGKTGDVTVLDKVPLEPGAFYIMDRGYIDFLRLYTLAQNLVFFVVRGKRNHDYTGETPGPWTGLQACVPIRRSSSGDQKAPACIRYRSAGSVSSTKSLTSGSSF